MPDDSKDALLREAYRLSELALASDAAAAGAADARAMGSASIFLAASAILAGMVDGDAPNYGILAAAFVFALAGGVAGYSARPRGFYFPGARFDDFEDDLAAGRDPLEALADMGRFNDKHSRHNRAILQRNARLIVASYALAVSAALIAILSHITLPAP